MARRSALIGPSFLVLTKGAALGITISFIALFVSLGWLWSLNSDLASQQQATARLAVENCQNSLNLRAVVYGLAVNQPNLDPRLVSILTSLLEKLPEACP